MSNLICGRTLSSDLLHPADRVYRSYGDTSRVAEPAEPIPVSVRVRPCSDTCPGVSWSHSGILDPGSLPVGDILDCYM